jgi:hypothetical protein
MDSFVIFEWEEVSPVSGDNEIGFAGNCTSKDVIIIRVFLNDVGDGLRDNEFSPFHQKLQKTKVFSLINLEDSSGSCRDLTPSNYSITVIL